jgi:hypothetical protein
VIRGLSAPTIDVNGLQGLVLEEGRVLGGFAKELAGDREQAQSLLTGVPVSNRPAADVRELRSASKRLSAVARLWAFFTPSVLRHPVHRPA